jgi:hypothetical protein
MYVLRESVTVFVTADTEAERVTWTEAITAAAGGATIIEGTGLWEGIREPSSVITAYTDDSALLLKNLAPVLAAYKVAANQSVVGVVVNGTFYGFETEAELERLGEALEFYRGE